MPSLLKCLINTGLIEYKLIQISTTIKSAIQSVLCRVIQIPNYCPSSGGVGNQKVSTGM